MMTIEVTWLTYQGDIYKDTFTIPKMHNFKVRGYLKRNLLSMCLRVGRWHKISESTRGQKEEKDET